MTLMRFHLVGGETVDVEQDIPDDAVEAEGLENFNRTVIDARLRDGTQVHIRTANVTFVEYRARPHTFVGY